MATTPNPSGKEMPFVKHLLELRDRLLKVVLAIIIVFLPLSPFASDLFHLLAEPLMRFLPEGAQMIAIDVIAPFFTPFKLTLILAAFLTIPYSFYHLWGFVAPALYQHEKKLILPLLFSSTLLFYLGMMFAYYIVFPLVFNFMVVMTPEGVSMMTDISRYLDFVLKMFFAFGIAFQVPVVTVILVAMEMTTPESLAEKRPYIIVGAFVVGMLMTPPDAISQTFLAIPIWILFEIGLLFSKMVVEKKAAREREEEQNNSANTSSEKSSLDEFEKALGHQNSGDDKK